MTDEKVFTGIINREIDRLLDRLERKGVCLCCAANGLLFRGAYLFESMTSRGEAVTMCEEGIDSLHEQDDVSSDSTRH